MVKVRDLLSLMQYEERVNVVSAENYWSSLSDGYKTAGEVLGMKYPDDVLDSSVACVYRSIHDRIVIEIE